MMQENLRHSYSLIVDLRQPISFCVRGRLPYPSGLLAVSTLFRNCKPADVYAHKYFIEKQSNPSQPSPQMHITEESQSIMKVISGLRYMKDDNSKLDNTMYICTDFDIPADGRMLQCMKDLKKERELQSRLEKVEEAKAEQTVVPEKGTDDVVAKRYQSRLDAFVEQLTNESKAVGSMRKEKEPQTLKQLLKSARGKAKTDDDEEYDYASDSSAANGPPSLRSVIGSGSTTFPSAADAMEQSNVYRFFEEANRISQKADKTNTGAFMDNVEGSLGREPLRFIK
ncbi:hypothetical protein AGDE_14804 [Angomonas deanei]|uniref:Uncharacterized protein n=1 Tax=Angomonas deanei TaxID=59799 RepID=A0A7G2CPF1_9TRYP|nr:hypothetical protein AGDE_14804 [Angomonas deanei]CAD2221229.1 hypothetical protein, conserved [Angomonas deanei]|eukprot:EPY20197.1 hypothetical protein AGDE_14804 [Angomonas deanei]